MQLKKEYLLLFVLLLPLSLISQTVKVYDSESAKVEATIAINPTNPKNLIGAVISISSPSKHIDVFYSFI